MTTFAVVAVIKQWSAFFCVRSVIHCHPFRFSDTGSSLYPSSVSHLQVLFCFPDEIVNCKYRHTSLKSLKAQLLFLSCICKFKLHPFLHVAAYITFQLCRQYCICRYYVAYIYLCSDSIFRFLYIFSDTFPDVMLIQFNSTTFGAFSVP